MACVYSLTFSNGKQYIGQTRFSAENRFYNHRRASKNGVNSFVYNAWRKYGEPVLKTLIICTKEDLNYYETACIKLYNTFGNGYNSDSGGNAPTEVSPEVGKKISKANKGRVQTEKHRKKNSEANSGTGNPMYGISRVQTEEEKLKRANSNRGKKRTPETCGKISKSLLGKPLSEEHKQALRGPRAKGRVTSEETKQKLRVIQQAYWTKRKQRNLDGE